jgi:hypothetical protein
MLPKWVNNEKFKKKNNIIHRKDFTGFHFVFPAIFFKQEMIPRNHFDIAALPPYICTLFINL